MPYLVILVLLAGGGILKLWLYQRRHARLDEVDDFWSGLEQIARQPAARPVRPVRRTEERSAFSARPSSARMGSRPAPLDPARRAAAKRRIEARRRGAGRLAG